MKLRFTSRAADELEEVIQYIRNQSPQGAKSVRARFHKMTQRLGKHEFGLTSPNGDTLSLFDFLPGDR